MLVKVKVILDSNSIGELFFPHILKFTIKIAHSILFSLEMVKNVISNEYGGIYKWFH